jgi:hypothetical protein
MIRITITEAAFDAIASTMPLGSVAYEARLTEGGEIDVWLDQRALDRLEELRGATESYSDVIVRIAGSEARTLRFDR